MRQRSTNWACPEWEHSQPCLWQTDMILRAVVRRSHRNKEQMSPWCLELLHCQCPTHINLTRPWKLSFFPQWKEQVSY